MKPTIKTIAEHAGVSVGTVDRVLHGRPKVSPEKRKRVEEAIKKLKYKPNAAARSLALQGQNVQIGIIRPPWNTFFRNEHERGIATAQSELDHYGIAVRSCDCETEESAEYIAAIDRMIADGARALAICAKNVRAIQKKIAGLTADGFPVATFNSDLTESGRLCYIGEDGFKSGRVAGDLMAKLLPANARIVIVCASLGFYSLKSRVKGFLARFEELGRDTKCHVIVESRNDYQHTYDGVLEHLERDRSINGVYLASESTVGGVDAVKKVNGAGQIRIVCHDVPDTTAAFLAKGVIDFAVDQNVYYQGWRPASMLAQYLLTGTRPAKDFDYTPTRIVTSEVL